MSDLAVSALDGASYDGIVTVREMGLQGMVSLRGDLSSAAMAKAVKSATGGAMPAPRAVVATEGGAVAWMSPDEVLILCPHAEADATVDALTKALAKAHHLAVNLSDARVMFEVKGEAGALRDVLAKLTPADLSADSLKPGELRRSRLAQVPGAFWFVDETTLRVIAFRSVAKYVFDLLAMSAKPGGEVGYF
jgi:sarcosine oxidase subunit gamma